MPFALTIVLLMPTILLVGFFITRFAGWIMRHQPAVRHFYVSVSWQLAAVIMFGPLAVGVIFIVFEVDFWVGLFFILTAVIGTPLSILMSIRHIRAMNQVRAEH